MSIKEVIRYETLDGQIFKTERAAEIHEKFITIENWYDENKLYGDRDGAYVEFYDLIKWIRDNKEKVLIFLESEDE